MEYESVKALHKKLTHGFAPSQLLVRPQAGATYSDTNDGFMVISRAKPTSKALAA